MKDCVILVTGAGLGRAAALEAYCKIQADEWADLPNLRINLFHSGARQLT